METKIHFNSGALTLEGMWHSGTLQHAAVICHPHPLYGGNMQNPVVATAASVYAQKGLSTLRFNFRGVGSSTGGYDNGNGEQNDLLAALEWIRSKKIDQILIVGYSFGAWVSALTCTGNASVTELVLISPPVAFMQFPATVALPSLSMVITGEYDDFGPPELIRSQVKNWNPRARLKILPNADHFFSMTLPDLKSVLSKHQLLMQV